MGGGVSGRPSPWIRTCFMVSSHPDSPGYPTPPGYSMPTSHPAPYLTGKFVSFGAAFPSARYLTQRSVPSLPREHQGGIEQMEGGKWPDKFWPARISKQSGQYDIEQPLGCRKTSVVASVQQQEHQAMRYVHNACQREGCRRAARRAGSDHDGHWGYRHARG